MASGLRSFASDQILPRNWMIFRRSRSEGLPAGSSSNCFVALRSAATFRRRLRRAAMQRYYLRPCRDLVEIIRPIPHHALTS